MTGGMTSPRSGYGGVAWVLLYVLFTAVQGVWLGSFLQRVDFFATVFVYFALTMLFFLALFVLRGKSIVALVRACGWKDIAVLNILTCASWLSYFAAIKYIEPAVEAAIGSAVPVITTLIILYAQGNRNFNRHNLFQRPLFLREEACWYMPPSRACPPSGLRKPRALCWEC